MSLAVPPLTPPGWAGALASRLMTAELALDALWSLETIAADHWARVWSDVQAARVARELLLDEEPVAAAAGGAR